MCRIQHCDEVPYRLADGEVFIIPKPGGWPRPHVNSTPTNTARTELHSMIRFHHANMFGSRLKSWKAQDCTSLCPWDNCHPRVMSHSFATPDADHKHRFSLTHLIYFSCLSDSLTFKKTPFDSQPIFSLRWSMAEWRINTIAIYHRL